MTIQELEKMKAAFKADEARLISYPEIISIKRSDMLSLTENTLMIINLLIDSTKEKESLVHKLQILHSDQEGN